MNIKKVRFLVKLNKRQIEQEKEYCFPYHYLVDSSKLLNLPDKFTISVPYLDKIAIIKGIIGSRVGNKLLDAGCGDGRLLFELKDKNLDLYGIDYSEKAISFAKVFVPNANLSVQDLTAKLTFKDELFDYVVLMDVLEHIEPSKIPKLLGEVSRVLKKNGVLVINVPSKNRKVSKKHYQHFDYESLTNCVSRFFILNKVIFHHKISFFFNSIFYFFVLIFYFAYPLKFLGFNVSGFVNKLSKSFFLTFLSKAGKNNGFKLIAVCKKV